MYAFSLSKLDKLEKQQNKSLKQTVTNNSFVNRGDSIPLDQQKEGEEGKFVNKLSKLILDQYGQKNEE